MNMPKPEDERVRAAEFAVSPLGVPLGPRRALWLRLVDGALLAKFGLTLLLVWVTLAPGGCNPSLLNTALEEVGTEPGPVTGARVVAVSPWLWLTVGPLAWIVARGLVVRPLRRTALHAFGVGMFRAGLILSIMVIVVVSQAAGNGTVTEPGCYLAMFAFFLMLAFQMVHVVRTWRPLREYRRRRPWTRRWDWWLAPPVIANLVVALLVTLAAVTMTVGALADDSITALPVVLAWLPFWAFLLAMSAWGIWQRETWGCWAHLLQGSLLLAFCTLPCVAVLDRPGHVARTALVILVVLFLMAWWLCGFFIGYRFSAHRLQRRRCWRCGEKRWIRIDRCNICGERYWIHKDMSAAPVCLACGNERQGPLPVCNACGVFYTADSK